MDVFAGGATLRIEIETFADGQVVVAAAATLEANTGRLTRETPRSGLLERSEVSEWLAGWIQGVLESMLTKP